MNQIETLQQRVKYLQQAVEKSNADYQKHVANHNVLVGRLAEAQYNLEKSTEIED